MSTTTYPIATIAMLLMCTPRWVQHLSREGVIPKAERGHYELVPAVQGYIKYLRDRTIGADLPDGGGDHKINAPPEKSLPGPARPHTKVKFRDRSRERPPADDSGGQR